MLEIPNVRHWFADVSFSSADKWKTPLLVISSSLVLHTERLGPSVRASVRHINNLLCMKICVHRINMQNMRIIFLSR